MKELNLRNVALMALVASWFIQVGGQVFALVSVDSILVLAPPRSFAMLQGEYRYDSEAFWSTVPMITSVLLIGTLVTNWRTQRRALLLVVLALFVVLAFVSVLYLDPMFNELNAVAYRDAVDPSLQAQAAMWHSVEWTVWSGTLCGGLVLLLALVRPGTTTSASSRLPGPDAAPPRSDTPVPHSRMS